MSIKDALSSFIYEKIKRNPMILPIIVEVNNNELHDAVNKLNFDKLSLDKLTDLTEI